MNACQVLFRFARFPHVTSLPTLSSVLVPRGLFFAGCFCFSASGQEYGRHAEKGRAKEGLEGTQSGSFWVVQVPGWERVGEL